MKILLTGAFGNIGSHVLEILLSRNRHELLCSDLRTPRTEREMRRLSRLGKFETRWGDISDPAVPRELVRGARCIIHLAAIIPPLSEHAPDLVTKVNIEGTRNLIRAACDSILGPKFIFTSSVTVHGKKHSSPPPRRAHEEPEPSDNYTHSKVASETELKASGLPWTVLRVGAAVSKNLMEGRMKHGIRMLFDTPLDQRIEVVHPRDAAMAVSNCVEAETGGKILYLGGGQDWQMTYREFAVRVFGTIGLSAPPASAFIVPKDDNDYWYTDFMDTEESQKLLKFQNSRFEEYVDELKKAFGWKRTACSILDPVISRFILSYSPHYRENRKKKS
jgi:nucleoside-diphosphate-sugar epimerase